MLRIRLVTVEDENPAAIYEETRAGLADWLFIRKGLVALASADSGAAWVTNLKDWRQRVREPASRDDLTFCTVDLKIPAQPKGLPEVRHGLALVHEIQAEAEHGMRCCILTGLSGSELESLMGDSIPGVLFDFKTDCQQGYPSIVNHIRSQALSMMKEVRFPASDGQPQLVLLAEKTGQLRDHFLSTAAYLIEPTSRHVPFLLIGNGGLGAKTFLEFVAYLSGAELEVIDLRNPSLGRNRENYARLRRLLEELSTGNGRQRMVYVPGIDQYEPEANADSDENCLWPLLELIEGPDFSQEQQPLVAFSVAGTSRLRIRSAEARQFLRTLESTIAGKTGFPLEYLQMDENGWTVSHPRMLRLPTLAERGKLFLRRVVDAQLDLLSERVGEVNPAMRGQRLCLADDVFDFFTNKNDWSGVGNLRGLVTAIKQATENFVSHHSTGQMRITRAHLDDTTREWMRRIILNVDDVSLELPDRQGNPLQIIENADFSVENGELLVILGPSGCGKSTILRLLAGLLRPTRGRIAYQGEEVTGTSEKIGMVFQDYSLFPWLTVFDNVAFGPRQKGKSPEELKPQVDQLLEVAKLTSFEDAYASQLSGGMRQRVAIVRALANEPEVLLMDEPFGALDLQTRWQMQDFLLSTRKVTAKTVVFVTHDIDEAVFLADRIFIASPRPLRLGRSFRVPFAIDDRLPDLRRDPAFVALVDQVRDALFDSASRYKNEERR